MCYHENTLVIVLAASRSPADCKEDTKEDINWSLTNYLMSGSETVKCVTQTRNADHSPSKEKSCALPWQRSRYLVYVILFFFFTVLLLLWDWFASVCTQLGIFPGNYW